MVLPAEKKKIKIKNPKEITKNRWKEKTFQKLGLQRNPSRRRQMGVATKSPLKWQAS